MNIGGAEEVQQTRIASHPWLQYDREGVGLLAVALDAHCSTLHCYPALQQWVLLVPCLPPPPSFNSKTGSTLWVPGFPYSYCWFNDKAVPDPQSLSPPSLPIVWIRICFVWKLAIIPAMSEWFNSFLAAKEKLRGGMGWLRPRKARIERNI